MDFIGTFVFSNFDVRHVASQRFVFTKNNIVLILFDHIVIFPYFFEFKKDALTFSEDWSKTRPVNSDIRPFGAILDNVGTKTTPA